MFYYARDKLPIMINILSWLIIVEKNCLIKQYLTFQMSHGIMEWDERFLCHISCDEKVFLISASYAKLSYPCIVLYTVYIFIMIERVLSIYVEQKVLEKVLFNIQAYNVETPSRKQKLFLIRYTDLSSQANKSFFRTCYAWQS